MSKYRVYLETNVSVEVEAVDEDEAMDKAEDGEGIPSTEPGGFAYDVEEIEE